LRLLYKNVTIALIFAGLKAIHVNASSWERSYLEDWRNQLADSKPKHMGAGLSWISVRCGVNGPEFRNYYHILQSFYAKEIFSITTSFFMPAFDTICHASDAILQRKMQVQDNIVNELLQNSDHDCGTVPPLTMSQIVRDFLALNVSFSDTVVPDTEDLFGKEFNNKLMIRSKLVMIAITCFLLVTLSLLLIQLV